MAGGAEKNGTSGWQTGFRKTRERKGKVHGNDHLFLRPRGRVLEGGREGPEEFCWEILHVGGTITTGDFIFLYQSYKNPTFLNSSKFGSSNSY